MSDKSLFEGAFVKRESFFRRIFGNLSAVLEPSSGLVAVPGDAPVHFDMMREDSVLSRLAEQLGFAFAELRRDPAGFFKVLVSPDENNPDQIKTRQAAWALTVAVPVMVVGAFLFGIALYLFIFGRPVNAVEVAEAPQIKITDFNVADMPDMPKKADRSGGGGGGGRQEPTPPSKGRPPIASLKPPIVAPTTHNPPKPPELPVTPTMQVDPKVAPPPDPANLGLPTGVAGPPSDGPGSGNGIGTGKGGGVGPGDGTGYGPGHGWNTGGGDPRIGGGDRDDRTIATKAQILNKPRPAYTEQARQNKTQGNVVVKVLLGGNGRVKSASVIRGLPDGLNEKAIQAVYQLQFTPARNGAGQPVDSWLTVSVNFTIR